MFQNRNLLEMGVEKVKEVGHEIKEGAKKLAHKADDNKELGGSRFESRLDSDGERVASGDTIIDANKLDGGHPQYF